MLGEQIVEFMNDLIKLDREAISTLVNMRVACNMELAKHKTVQVTPDIMLGLLGILNGIVGWLDEGYIFAEFDDAGFVKRFFYRRELEDVHWNE